MTASRTAPPGPKTVVAFVLATTIVITIAALVFARGVFARRSAEGTSRSAPSAALSPQAPRTGTPPTVKKR